MTRSIWLLVLVLCMGGTILAEEAHKAKSDDSDERVALQAWTCATAQGAQARRRQVESNFLPRVVFEGEDASAKLAARLRQHKTPALSVAVIRNGELDWSAAWGRLQIDGKRADCDSLFQAGSLAKPVTLLAALRMQQQGLIEFGKSIDSYLTSYQLPAGKQSDAHPVTLRNLFAHTAGITPGGYDGYAQGQPLPSDLQTLRAEAPSNSRRVEVLETPDGALVYSGGGYTVIEIALQDQLKKPFEAIMREWLFLPVGMRQADFTQPLPAAKHARTARGHRGDGSAVPGGWHNHPEQAAAGLWATASDLATLLIEIRKAYRGESAAFSHASVGELLGHPVEGHVSGFRMIGEGAQVFLTHYGGTLGYRAGMTLNLVSGDGAVYLTNADGGAELGVEFLGAVARTYDWPVFRELRVERAEQSADVLRSLVGRYQFTDGPTISVVYEGSALVINFPNGDRYAMTPIAGAPLSFIHADSAVRASFEGEGGNLRIRLYGETGKRLPEQP